ncbi:MAG TPA: AAA family ATPase [Anaerohalosphaeraceae bacterium]|jgi:chromosome partitioning protein|nr:AAA family ATPase [Anaerohalosphaeraceae bacterium]HOT73797.1 AAA family ATPase [Anaerohalosphaeraceae bacterium]HPB94000.1 AAA family ATPase [Anaerohalosphaeraceae bacterium]HQG05036.1 AAA family ATPase [Anaerohalosphaeraceae bacterium]HQI08182.1 AAA family ATPase [Anaerohalosphaeraceae bacterium]
MRTVAIINQKGGCGKTTVSINLSSALAAKGCRTLLVDLDPQSHCAVGLAVPEEQIEQSIYDVLIGKARGEPLRLREILWQISDRFELAPSSIDLAAFESQMSGVMDRENCLKSVLEEVRTDYDYVIIDCPPSVGLLTFNALRAATDVIVPVEMGYFSLHGLSKQLETLQVLCEQCRQKVNLMVLASMYDIRTKMGREILAELRKHFGERMFQTVVNFNTKLKEAASLGQPIGEYDPASKGYKDFLNLAEELIGTDTLVHKAELVDTLEARIQTISASAEELLATIKEPQGTGGQRAAEATAAAVAQDNRTFEEKIADFYGVRQESDGVVFSTLYPRAQTVQIAGDFNDWIPEQTPMQRTGENGKWIIKLPLNKGTYRYRLVVDGQWQQDPYNENIEVNPFGEYNSVLHVK